MNIIIHTGDPYYEANADAIRMHTFAEAFTAAGHSVYVLTPPGGKEVSSKGETVIFCKTRNLRSRSAANRLMNQIGFGISSLRESKKVPACDIVITSSPPALIGPFGWLIGKRFRASLVFDVRDIWPDVAWEMGSFSPKSLYSKAFRAVRDFMLKKAKLVTTVSLGKVIKLNSYRGSDDVMLVSNGLDEHFLELPKDGAPDLGLDPVCVYIGKLGLAQGLDQLLGIAERAMKENVRCNFLLYGEGVSRDSLEHEAEEKGLTNVRFMGPVAHDAVAGILDRAAVSFVPLVNERLTDSVPTKLFESIGAGCPTLLAARGEACDILTESGMGTAVRPNDGEALYGAFRRLLAESAKLKSENALRAKQFVQAKYSRQKQAELLEKEINDRFNKEDK